MKPVTAAGEYSLSSLVNPEKKRGYPEKMLSREKSHTYSKQLILDFQLKSLGIY